jgi:hypothetical protein
MAHEPHAVGLEGVEQRRSRRPRAPAWDRRRAAPLTTGPAGPRTAGRAPRQPITRRRRYPCWGQPCSSGTGSPAPASATCMRVAPARTNRCSTASSHRARSAPSKQPSRKSLPRICLVMNGPRFESGRRLSGKVRNRPRLLVPAPFHGFLSAFGSIWKRSLSGMRAERTACAPASDADSKTPTSSTPTVAIGRSDHPDARSVGTSGVSAGTRRRAHRRPPLSISRSRKLRRSRRHQGV